MGHVDHHSRPRGGSIEGAKKTHPLQKHLADLEEAVFQWLDTLSYENASPVKQRAMRKQALLPTNMKAQMPRVYRLFKLCDDGRKNWWPGGVGDQPHLLMLEFSACRNALGQFQSTLRNKERILGNPSKPPKLV